MGIIETKRLILRPFDLSDAESMFRNWAKDPDVLRFMPYELCATVEDTQKHISQWLRYFEETAANSALFAIVLKDSSEVIGTIDFAETDKEARSAEVGYQLGKAWWGQGYATEALRALIKYCFERVKLNRLWASYDSRNPASGKVLQKAAMKYEGTLRQCKVRRGELSDSVRYAILAEEYFSKKAKQQQIITYRPYITAHLDGILRLSQDWFHENITFGVVPDAAEDVASYENEYFHVALDGECVVAYITAEIIEENEYNIFPHGARYLRVNNLYVDMDYRGRGIGEELLALAEQKADENNVQHIFISSATKDADAVRKFYQGKGYAVWATSFYKRKGWDVRVYPLGDLSGYRYTVIFARYKGKWLYCRAKARDTFETPGGHIEKGETILEAAKRELYEETGATKFSIKPVFDYAGYREDEFANGQVFLAEIHELGDMPAFEMAEVILLDTIPQKMRFPQILPVLFEKVKDMAYD